MTYRPFTSMKTVTSSEYNAIKKLNHINIGKNNYSNNSSKLLLLKKEKSTCFPITSLSLLCDKAPVTLTDGKTSYTCNNNTFPERVCNSLPRVLYPYGYYLCFRTNCSACLNVAALPPVES